MSTIRLVPSTYAVSNGSYVTVTDSENMYTNVDSTTYASIRQSRKNTSSTYYVYIRGFNFSDVPSNATVNSFTIKLRGYETNMSTSSSYRMSLYNNTTSISNTTVTSSLSTTADTFTFPNGSLTWSTLKGYGADFGIRVPLRRSSTSSNSYVYVYGAEILVDYNAETVHPTSVELDEAILSLEEGETGQLTATVLPSNATDKTVTWGSSNTSVATVSNGLVTAVGQGTARITVTTTDGGFTDYCDVTVTPAVTYTYVLANTMQPGKKYLIANGNSGAVYLLSNEANGSRKLKGVAATVSNNKITITGSAKAKTEFTCSLSNADNSVTTCIMSNGQYLYSNNANGLCFNTVSTIDRFWHYNSTKFWQFKSSGSDGYSDASSEYKYYLTFSNGDFTDSHVTTTSIENSTLPAIYLFTEDTGATDALYFKSNGSWVEATTVYKKVSGSWVVQADLTNVFDPQTNYVKGN